jgi:hypothetical protein
MHIWKVIMDFQKKNGNSRANFFKFIDKVKINYKFEKNYKKLL